MCVCVCDFQDRRLANLSRKLSHTILIMQGRKIISLYFSEFLSETSCNKRQINKGKPEVYSHYVYVRDTQKDCNALG